MKPSHNWEESLERAAERCTKPNWKNTCYCWLNNWFGWLPIHIPIAYCQSDLESLRNAVISFRVDYETYQDAGAEAVIRGASAAVEKTIANNLGLASLEQLREALEQAGELEKWEAIQGDISLFGVGVSVALFKFCYAQGRGPNV